MTHTFTTTIYWSALYEPMKPLALDHAPQKPRYGLCFNAADTPPALTDHVRARPVSPDRHPELSGLVYASITQPFTPVIDCSDYEQLRHLFEDAELANIRRDRLFHAIPVKLAVEPYEWDDMGVIRPKLTLLAVCVAYHTLSDSFDRIRAAYWSKEDRT